MQEWRRSGWANPMSWYAMLGLGLLGFSLAVPWLGASRTTRVERRADAVAECLLLAAAPFGRPLEEPDLQAVFARCLRLLDARGEYSNDLERIDDAPADTLLLLGNKHYLFHLAVSPPAPEERIGPDTVPALEVAAWPRNSVAPGHCAFFYSEHAERAYTRNLRKGYVGLDPRPMPGRCHRRPGLANARRGQYSSYDDERWILF